MDKTALVEMDFKDGATLIEYLDNAQFDVHSAFWLYNCESEQWRLIIASDLVDLVGPREAYTKIKTVIDNIDPLFGIQLQNISVISPLNPLVKILGTSIKTSPTDIKGIRLSRNIVGNSFIEDAFIYRIQ